MARISTYTLNDTPEQSDILIGTDVNSGLATKNFRLGDVGDSIINNWLKNSKFTFTTDIVAAPTGNALLYFEAGGGSPTDWDQITTIRCRTLMGNGSTAAPYLEYLLTGDPAGGASAGKEIIFKDVDRLSSFGVYKFTDLNIVSTDIYDLDLQFVQGSGSISSKKVYSIEGNTQAQASTYIFNQITPSTVWTINHNLDSYPSVTVVNINDIKMYGNVVYVDKNNLTITFSAGFTGKAYLN